MNEIIFQEKPKIGDTVEGRVIALEQKSIYVEILPFGSAIIWGREFLNAKFVIKEINIGDTIKGKIISTENEAGYMELSLNEARESFIWKEVSDARKNKSIIEVIPVSANKGGLIINWKGIKGFLPASQLSSKNYPKIEDGNKDKILSELNNLVGQTLKVCILGFDNAEEKIFFSEKEITHPSSRSENDLVREKINYKLGDILDVKIVNITNFGIFVNIKNSNDTAMIHISEISWSLVENPNHLYSIGNQIKAQIIDINNEKKSLSIKRLQENPWEKIAQNYPIGSKIEGVVIKYEKYGAFVSIQEGVTGLLHLSEFSNDDSKMKNNYKLGQKYELRIADINTKEQRLSLGLIKKIS